MGVNRAMIETADGAKKHLLVVDDDDRIRDLLKTYLTRAGFRVSVAADATAARARLAGVQFDLIVLDVMMPGEDGFSLVRWLRSESAAAKVTPVLLLSARGLPNDRIEGLSLGADDYLPKPFEPRELVLRIEAILRRVEQMPVRAESLTLGRYRFDPARGELTDPDGRIRLTEAESLLLRRLAQNANAPVDRAALVSDAADGGGRAVDIHVTRLRRKIEPDPGNPQYLRTVRGQGYMLTPD